MANDTTNTTRTISRSERTNAKNLENLNIARSTIDTISNFDPTNPLIKKNALGDFAEGFAAKLQAANEAAVAEDAAVEAQTAAFKLIPKKITKIINAVKAHGVSAETLEHLMTTVRRLRGARVTNKTPDGQPPDGENGATVSVSQQSIAGIIEGLNLFGEQIRTVPNFKPNEVEYQPEAISTWIAGLSPIRNSRLDAQAVAVGVRQQRDDYCYGSEGVIVRMKALKAYLETILDKSDDRYKRIKALKFVDTGK